MGSFSELSLPPRRSLYRPESPSLPALLAIRHQCQGWRQSRRSGREEGQPLRRSKGANPEINGLPAPCPSVGLPAEGVAGDEDQIGRALGHATRQVGVPLCAVGNVDAHVVALLRELLLQVAADAVQHLKLEARLGDAMRGGEAARVRDQALVVRGDGGIRAALQQREHQLAVRRVHVGLARVGNRGRFQVRALHQAHACLACDQRLNVLRRAIEHRLDYRAHVVVVVVQLRDDLEGRLRVVGAFHVYPHEDVELAGTLQHAHEVGARLRRADIQPKRRQLDRDVGISRAGGDTVEDLDVVRGGRARLCAVGDILAEMIERGTDMPAIQLFRDVHGLVERLARDEAPRDTSPHRIVADELTDAVLLRQIKHRVFQHVHRLLAIEWGMGSAGGAPDAGRTVPPLIIPYAARLHTLRWLRASASVNTATCEAIFRPHAQPPRIPSPPPHDIMRSAALKSRLLDSWGTRGRRALKWDDIIGDEGWMGRTTDEPQTETGVGPKRCYDAREQRWATLTPLPRGSAPAIPATADRSHTAELARHRRAGLRWHARRRCL